MLPNPYFHPQKAQETGATPEVKQYPAQPANQPDITPEGKKGLTSIIMPVYFKHYPVFHYTGHAIGSIREHTNKTRTPYELIIVQNGEDGVEHFTQENHKNLYADKIVFNKTNLGYSKAVNQGIRIASGEFIAIVNNDICVYDHWLDDMQDALNHGLDLVMAMPMYGMPFARAVEAKAFRDATITEGEPASDSIKKTFSEDNGHIDFSCVLTRKKIFSEVGLFNEEFFMYGEDIDLLRRLKEAKKNYAATRRVRTFHISGGTASGVAETPEIMNQSRAKLKEIWGY